MFLFLKKFFIIMYTQGSYIVAVKEVLKGDTS